jgi:structure-specific endonuclease subunit SLX1
MNYVQLYTVWQTMTDPEPEQTTDLVQENAAAADAAAVEEKKVQFVYLLVSSDGATYVGATMNLDRRLRQHNKEIKGGAHATGSRVARGETWQRHCYVSGFPDWPAALQFEWRWKQLTRKITSKRISPVERRMMALEQLLAMERPTTKAIAYAEWPSPPEVHMES